MKYYSDINKKYNIVCIRLLCILYINLYLNDFFKISYMVFGRKTSGAFVVLNLRLMNEPENLLRKADVYFCQMNRL